MGRGFNGLGVCAQCGDTEGPWSLVSGLWLCDDCAEEVANKEDNNGDDNREGTEED